MIVAQIAEQHLLAALRRAAHAEEEVVCDAERMEDALKLGFPRLMVRLGPGGGRSSVSLERRVPVLTLTTETLAGWDTERRKHAVPPGRVAYFTARLSDLLQEHAMGGTWVDRTLADLTRASGRLLPVAFRCFARRVLEFPAYYTDLHPVAAGYGLSRGALKARFRRRGLPSPYGYLRWLRVIAAAHTLSDPHVTVARAARRLGFTSDGNLCRSMNSVSGLTPTEARTSRGRNHLLLAFASSHLLPEGLEAWSDLQDLFTRRSA